MKLAVEKKEKKGRRREAMACLPKFRGYVVCIVWVVMGGDRVPRGAGVWDIVEHRGRRLVTHRNWENI